MTDQEIQVPFHPAELVRLGLERIVRADSAEKAIRIGGSAETRHGMLSGAPLVAHAQHLRDTAGSLILAGLVGALVDPDGGDDGWASIYDFGEPDDEEIEGVLSD